MRWLAITLATLGTTLLFKAVGLPTPAMFAGLIVGLTAALSPLQAPARVPGPIERASQAVLGVSIGFLVQIETLKEIAGNLPVVIGVTVLTIALSLGASVVLHRLTGVDRVTAAFGMVAGGAGQVISVSRELGADGRLVAVMQYMRVLIIVLSAPLIARALPAGESTSVASVVSSGVVSGTAFLLLCGISGVGLARLLRLPAGAMLGPILVAGTLTASGFDGAAQVPGLVLQCGYAVIGLSVGLTFTPASMRNAISILPVVFALTVMLLLMTAATGMLLVLIGNVSVRDAYLATTPGGLYSVLAAAKDVGSDTTFVMSIQLLRLLSILIAAPLVASWLQRTN